MSTKKETKSKKMIGNFQELLKNIKSSQTYEIEVVRDLISEQISKAMSTERISKAQLARKLNTSAAYVTKLLQGNGNFTIETLVKIATALDYKFRPVLVPMNPDWKKLARGNAESASFQPHEKRVTRSINYVSINRVGVDLYNSKIVDKTLNNERTEPIAN